VVAVAVVVVGCGFGRSSQYSMMKLRAQVESINGCWMIVGWISAANITSKCC
jgi:hypothetical protein